MNFYPLVVSDIIDETPSTRSFVLHVEDKYKGVFEYQAGQFLSLRLPWQESYLDRCYSLSSIPREEQLKITVKRVLDGRASNYLNERIKTGDIIDVAPPSGRFVLKDATRPLCLFAAGSGITPVISIVKDALENSERRINLLYANSNWQQIIFADELTQLEQQYPERLVCQHHISSESGRVNETTITEFIDELSEQDFYICGPAPFMDLVESVLEKFGVDDHQIMMERFISDAQSSTDDGEDVSSDVSSFTALLDNDKHTVPYLAGKTLLESMLAHDLKPSYFCQKARCGMCVATKTSGEIIMRNSEILSDNEKTKGQILLCQSVPLNQDVVVDCDRHS